MIGKSKSFNTEERRERKEREIRSADYRFIGTSIVIEVSDSGHDARSRQFLEAAPELERVDQGFFQPWAEAALSGFVRLSVIDLERLPRGNLSPFFF